MGLRESYGALPAEGQQFLREKQIDANWWPDAWIGFLGNLADYDAHADAKRKSTGWMLFWAIVFGIALTVMVAIAAPIAGVLVGVLAIGLITLLIVRWRAMRKTDLPGDNLRFVKTLVTVLKEDIAPGAGLRLRLDLRGSLHGAKQVHKSPEY